MSSKRKLFSLGDLKTRPSRNGFDLGFRTLFTAAPGQLLPIMCKESLPGDKFKLSANGFTRTQTLNTAAFARFKEYYDFFFVPTRFLWSQFPQWVVQSPYSDTTFYDYRSNQPNSDVPTYMPRFSLTDFAESLGGRVGDLGDETTVKDELGFNVPDTAQKLLDLLGYGAVLDSVAAGASLVEDNKVYANPFPLLGYQKIYQDFYRHHDWEQFDSSTFNVDYLDHGSVGGSPSVLPSNYSDRYYRLRYANFKRDYFFGLRPTTQYGDVSVVDVKGNTLLGEDGNPIPGSSGVPLSVFSDGKFGPSNDSLATLRSQYDILSLRKAEALQRWKEVTMAHDFRYKAQVRAHFGFDVPDSRSQMAEFIGGSNNVITISDIDATAGTEKTAFGQIGGKGVGASDGQQFDFECKEHGYIYCIYHIEPIIDFAAFGLKRQNQKFDVEDFYIPEYQNIGLSPVRFNELFLPWNWFSNNDSGIHAKDFSEIMGYAPRYLDYKTSYDEVHGSFIKPVGTVNSAFHPNIGSLSAWSVQALTAGVFNEFSDSLQPRLDYRFFKIDPSVVDSIFAVRYNGSERTDQFMCATNFNILAVRSMSVDGMPY